MGDIGAGGTSFFLSPAQAASGEGAPGLINPAAPYPHQINPRGFWVLSGGLQSTVVPEGVVRRKLGDGKQGTWEGDIVGDREPQSHSPCPWAQALSLRICLALGQSAARQPLEI